MGSVLNSTPSPDRTASLVRIEKLSQRVRLEAHRMRGFVRFEKVAGGKYFALIAPVHNVLPLIRRHFERRYADQH
jgi:probable DNA metabolism protein